MTCWSSVQNFSLDVLHVDSWWNHLLVLFLSFKEGGFVHVRKITSNVKTSFALDYILKSLKYTVPWNDSDNLKKGRGSGFEGAQGFESLVMKAFKLFSYFPLQQNCYPYLYDS